MLWRAEPRNALPCGAARRIARHRAASRCLAALGAADQPVAQHVLFGEDGDLGRGEAVIEREDDEGNVTGVAPARSAAERPWPSWISRSSRENSSASTPPTTPTESPVATV